MSLFPFQIASEVAVVEGFDVEALDVAGAIAQLVGLEQALLAQRRLSSAAVANPMRVRHRRTRHRSRPHVEGAAGYDRAAQVLHRVAVGLQRVRATASSLQRAASSTSRWWRAIRQPAFGTASPSGSVRSEHLLSATPVPARRRGYPRSRSWLRAARGRTDCQAPQSIPCKTAAPPVRTHTTRATSRVSRCIRRLVHQWQRSSDAFVGDEAEKRRLLKLHRESLSERIVEHRVARRVGELSEHDAVLVGELRLSRIEDVAHSAPERLRRQQRPRLSNGRVPSRAADRGPSALGPIHV